MEDNNNQGSRNLYKDLMDISANRAASGKPDMETVPSKDVPEHFRHCDHVYRSVFKHNGRVGYPIYLGVKDNDIVFSIGLDNPITLDKNTLAYLGITLSNLADTVLTEDLKISDVKKHQAEIADDIEISVRAIDASDALEEEKEALDTLKDQMMGNAEDSLDTSGLEEMQKEMTELVEEAKAKFDSMSEQEKKEYAKNLENKLYQIRAKKIKALEKTLLGNLEEEPSITYDYAYFKKIFDEKGVHAFREEIAKIPKDERPAMIKQITEQAKKEQQKPDNNNEAI
jgi:hypothetical protein